MQLSDERARRWATVAFVAIVGCFLLDAMVPVLARAAWGQGWSWDGSALDTTLAVMVMVFPVVGYLVARNEPRNPVGWILLAVGAVVAFPSSPYIEYGHRIRPGSLPGVNVLAALTAANWAPVIGLLGTFLILLFPDGHLPSPRWRPVAWLSGFSLAWIYLLVTFAPGRLEDAGVGAIQNPLGLSFLEPLLPGLLGTIVVLPLSMLLCAAGLVARFRRSSGTERLQLKWLATAGAVVTLMYAAAMVATLQGNWASSDPTWMRLLENAAVFSFALIPLAIGVAMLKHGLYGIDVVINKAVLLGLLAAFITVVYVAIVVGVGRLAGRGDRPNLVLSIAATTVVAVAFQPVRERAQRLANRLVYGRRATPYEVLSEFADRVGGAYAAAELLPVMAATVGEGVAAARVEIWLATGRGLVREATWPDVDRSAGTSTAQRTIELVGDRVVEVRHGGELLGALTVTKAPGESLRPAELRLLDDVAAQASLVLRNVRLVEELRGSRSRLMTSQDDERRRLERRLHDGAQRRLRVVAEMIDQARGRLGGEEPAASAVDQLAGQLQAATEELGELARGIHPAVLTELGLAAAVRGLAERAPVPVGADVRVERALPRTVEATLYFVAAEALTNVAKYAHATSVVLTLHTDSEAAVLEISDDGIGGVDESRGTGVRGLRDRVAAVDGSLVVTSPPGEGTRLHCVIPLAAEDRIGEQLALAGGRS